jgi:SAM-dependent methyltransferase
MDGSPTAPRSDHRNPPSPPWDAHSFDRIDPEPDTNFYAQPRFVQHIDDGAIASVTETILRYVPPGSDVLDLMSSWVSHLPDPSDLPLGRITGLGMNADELARNPRLDEWTTQDLNVQPRLPYPDANFDTVLITVSIQYLTQPELVLRDLARVLRPGGVLIVTFSNRMFPTKAVRIWQDTPDSDRPSLVAAYLEAVGGFAAPEITEHLPRSRWSSVDPLWAVIARQVVPDTATPNGIGSRPASSASPV